MLGFEPGFSRKSRKIINFYKYEKNIFVVFFNLFNKYFLDIKRESRGF